MLSRLRRLSGWGGALICALALIASGLPVATAAEDSPDAESCATSTTGAVLVTADCVDATYANAVIESEADVSSPTTLHVVRGYFEGTNSRFAVYLPPAERWQGRFFQYTYPLTDENAADATILFGVDSGAYTVQASGPTGYRHAAAAARLSRQIAADYYGDQERYVYGYLYGPSGGSFQTIGAAENTTGVWDGFVPTVMGTPVSIPNNFLIRAMGRLILGNVRQQISEAVLTGTDPYAGLDEAQSLMLEELSGLGVQLEGWEDPDYLLGYSFDDGLLGYVATVKAMDPTYADDFWAEPGYLGTEDSPLGEAVRAALVDATLTVTAVEYDDAGSPAVLETQGFPAGALVEGLDMQVRDNDGAPVGELVGTLDTTTGRIRLDEGSDAAALAALAEGAQITADNRWSIAARSYYRHQLPPQEEGFTVYDRFYDDAGEPLYPQRQSRIAGMMASSISGGATYSGLFQGKVILVSNLQDVDAYTWHAPWYVERVRSAQGDVGVDERLRIYVNENADHLEGPVTGEKSTRIVSYDPMVQRALRDLAAWVEDGVEPPVSTAYKIEDGQVVLPSTAVQRAGVQPVVTLTADTTTAKVGQAVHFEANADMPAAAGEVVRLEWAYTETGQYIDAADMSGAAVQTSVEHVFTEPGTYWVTVRATSAAAGSDSDFARCRISLGYVWSCRKPRGRRTDPGVDAFDDRRGAPTYLSGISSICRCCVGSVAGLDGVRKRRANGGDTPCGE
ncbi:PKD domain-containing protein [Actinomyces ruminis]|uniref:Tat pathway signal sequence domain protein n=1 Tax=Actinomyces ruminis TaxID=1937003 RepID=A0ABX4MEE3_9ACTO|nr:PKD domain-containing protein [Actinomyces ruminis]PHP53523.1 Tat pathway signal sequence domain protein [Actinomyces ruminis]